MLEHVGRGVCQVLILADHVQVTLRVLIEAHVVLEVDRVLLALRLAALSDLALFISAISDSLLNARIDQACKL